MRLFSKKLAPTQVTHDLEKMTKGDDNQELDWGLFYQVCQVVQSSPLAAKESRKLLQKKMLTDDPRTQTLALEVLNALSENATGFKNQLAAKSFGGDLESLATHKASNDQVHSKLVQCLQNWVSHYGSDPAFGAICRVHELVMHGMPSPQSSKSGGRLAGNFFKPYPLPPSMTSRPDLLPPPQMNDGGSHQQLPRRLPTYDIMSDVEIAKNNALLFAQTLSFTDPIQEDISKNELIQEFFAKCKGLQRLITGHLQTCEDSDKISALILANGELVNTFKTYDDMMERRALDAATNNSRAVNHRATRQDETLIDIDTETGPSGASPHVGTSTSASGSGNSGTGGVGGGFGDVSSAGSSRNLHLNEQKSSASGYHGSALPLPLTPQNLMINYSTPK